MKVTLRKNELVHGIFSIVVFFICFSNYYFGKIIPFWSVFQYYGKYFLGFILIMMLMFRLKYSNKIKKGTFSKTFLITILISLFIMAITFAKNGPLKECIDTFLSIIIIILYLELEGANSRNINVIFSIWIFIILSLTLVDIFTELKYPTGLYRTETTLYTEYWLLGYKTERLRYILPMMIMSIYQSFFNQKKFFTIFTCLTAITSTILSKATAASIVLILIFSVYLCLLFFSSKGKKEYPKIIDILFNYKILIIMYIFITIVIVFLENSEVAVMVSTFFQKGSNFSSRGRIWKKCLELISSSPIVGGGYHTVKQYQALTGMIAGTNAHNMVLTILVNGGAIGLITYAHLVFSVFKRKNTRRDYQRYSLALINYFIFILGITSSTIVFSTFGMFGFWVLEYYDKINMEA